MSHHTGKVIRMSSGWDAHTQAVLNAARPFVLRYGGRIAGRFATSEAALAEVERLSGLAVKRGELPKSFEVNEQR